MAIVLAGLAEIQELVSMLEREPGLKNNKLLVLPLHSSITLEEQGRVFDKPHILYRKVILSTNIAESSITVPDIKYGKLHTLSHLPTTSSHCLINSFSLPGVQLSTSV